MRIGLQIPSFKYPGGAAAIRPTLKEVVTTAEEAGFYSLWVMDHYYQIKGLFGEAHTDPMLEAYTTLGYFAGLTEKAYLGVLVTGVIYRHPSVLMKMVNTLDVLSGGRAYLGIGAAWYEEEARGYGIPYPSTVERFEQLEDTLKLAKALWAGDETSFAGKHFSAPAITNNPRPLSQPHPHLMIGGTGPNKPCAWSPNMRMPATSGIGLVKKICKMRSTCSKNTATPWDATTPLSRKPVSARCISPGRIRSIACFAVSKNSPGWASRTPYSTCRMSSKLPRYKPLQKKSSRQRLVSNWSCRRSQCSGWFTSLQTLKGNFYASSIWSSSPKQ